MLIYLIVVHMENLYFLDRGSKTIDPNLPKDASSLLRRGG